MCHGQADRRGSRGERRCRSSEDSNGVVRIAVMDASGSHSEASSGWASPTAWRNYKLERSWLDRKRK